MVGIRKGDTVSVRRGKDRGKKGQVMKVFTTSGLVLVEGINLVKKAMRAKRQGEKGQIISRPAPLRLSNVMLVCPSCQKPNRFGRQRQDGTVKRICKGCQAVLG